MKGEGEEAKKVTDKRKGRDTSKKSSLWRGSLQGHYFPVSILSPAGIWLLGWDRKQSMEVMAMAFPEEQEKNL